MMEYNKMIWVSELQKLLTHSLNLKGIQNVVRKEICETDNNRVL